MNHEDAKDTKGTKGVTLFVFFENVVPSWFVVAATLLALPVCAGAGPNVTLEAAAGVGGIVKAGRWAPLRVTITTAERSFDGELDVVWGDRQLRRAISLPSPGRRQFELYLRTSDPRGLMRVRLVAAGRELQAVEVPVRVVAADDHFTACVMSATGVAAAHACDATVSADRLPRSLRGYEAVDEVVWSDRGVDLDREQQAAFAQWRRFRALEQSGDLGLSPQPKRPLVRRGLSGPVVRQIAATSVAYSGALVLAGILATRRRASLTRTAVYVLAPIVVASAAAHAIGRAGIGRDVLVRHDSVLNQIPGTGASVLSMRGIIEYPAFDDFVVQLPLADGVMEAGSASRRGADLLDESGRPILRGRFGLGAHVAYSAEVVLEDQPLAVTTVGNTTTVTNRTGTTLERCRFADGFTTTDVGTIAPGGSVAARQVGDVLGPVLTCEAADPLVSLAVPDRVVKMDGTTVIAVYRHRGDAEPATDD